MKYKYIWETHGKRILKNSSSGIGRKKMDKFKKKKKKMMLTQ